MDDERIKNENSTVYASPLRFRGNEGETVRKRVLFVCVHNAGRSQMAEAFFNHLAKGKGKARSAGTQPAKRLDDNIIEIMREARIEISGQRPKLLTPKLLNWADKAITMGCGVEDVCPATFVETEDWALADPRGKSLEKVRGIREQIQAKVLKLLEKIP